jgi:formylmethanofuran dehydrogenase subunit C
VKPLVFSLRDYPDQRLDLSPLTPDRLVWRPADEIARIELQTTRRRVTVGDVFRVRLGDAQHIRIEGSCERLDRIGHAMTQGEIVVDGDAGAQAGRRMTGGRLTIGGSTGPWAASGMTGGVLEIEGAGGDRLGAPLAGETAGMRGGVVVVRGAVGERAGDRMRRGTMIVEGQAGDYAGCGMIAGTLIVRRAAGRLPGYLMRRGTIVLGEPCRELSPTFVNCGAQHSVAIRLMAAFVSDYSAAAASMLRPPLQRLAGDMATIGKGEIWLKQDQ